MKEKPPVHAAFQEAMKKLQDDYPKSTMLCCVMDEDCQGTTQFLFGDHKHVTMIAYTLLTGEETEDIFNTAILCGIQMDNEKITK